MKFEPNTVYHIFNQGNNKQLIFYQNRNYHFFLEKMKTHLLPLGEFICYCLMPNHFHWLFYTNEEACQLLPRKVPTIGESPPDSDLPMQRLNRAIGTLLSSYARAINRQEDRTGSLFRAKTKARDGWHDNLITVDGPYRKMFFKPENDYIFNCFDYIHKNPVEAGLVISQNDWLYSSARAYSKNLPNNICNINLGKKLLGLN